MFPKEQTLQACNHFDCRCSFVIWHLLHRNDSVNFLGLKTGQRVKTLEINVIQHIRRTYFVVTLFRLRMAMTARPTRITTTAAIHTFLS